MVTCSRTRRGLELRWGRREACCIISVELAAPSCPLARPAPVELDMFFFSGVSCASKALIDALRARAPGQSSPTLGRCSPPREP